MYDKLMYISMIINKFRYKLCVEKFLIANQDLFKYPKCLGQLKRKFDYITLGTSVIYNPMSSPSLLSFSFFHCISDE